ncbi:hypothetical protein LM73068_180006 [Listeria monocytogenes]|nr:hypothetical protein LM73068_180006 [Listeria monocytogenes]
MFLVLKFGYKMNIGGQAFMKKHRFSKFNINAGSVTRLVMFSSFFYFVSNPIYSIFHDMGILCYSFSISHY